MALGPTNAPGFSLPTIPLGAQVAVNEINQTGGINGHKLQLITCDDQNSPNTATQCVRQAIQQKVAALVGGLSVFDLQIDPLLKSAGIPWIGSDTPDDYTSTNLFLLGDEGVNPFAAVGLALAQHGCKRIAVIVSATAAAKVNTAQLEAGVRAGGAQVAGAFSLAQTSVDWAPTVSAVRSAGADCIASGTSPVQSGPLITAVATGPKLQLGFVSGGLPDAVVKQLGSAANGVLATAAVLPFGDQNATVQQLKQKVLAINPKSQIDGFVETGYAAVKVVAQAAKGLKDVTGPSLETALATVKGFDTGVGPVVDFSKPNAIPAFARVFNPKVYVWVAKNGEYVLSKPQPIDTSPALKLLSVK
jgi:branched-chain amino acid transport system substrate-binding protein